MILNEETKTKSIELSDSDIISMDQSSGDVTVTWIDDVKVDDIVEVHYKEDGSNIYHRYKVNFVDGPDAVISMTWLEMIDKTLHEANPFTAIKDKLTQDPAAKLDKGTDKQDKKEKKSAANILVRDTKEGAHWKYYIQLPNGSYVKKPLALKDIKSLYSSQMNPSITNAIVTTEGDWMVRQGLKDLHKTGTKFNPSLLDVDRSYSKDWTKEDNKFFMEFLKNNKDSEGVKIIKASVPAKEKPVNKSDDNSAVDKTTDAQTAPETKQETDSQQTVETKPDQLTTQNQGITKPIIDKFRKIAMATGLEVFDAFDKPVDMNSAASVGKINPETLVDYTIKIKGKDFKLTDWLVHAVKNKVITESCDIDKVISEGLLFESPVITLDNADLMNPSNIDFKEKGRQAAQIEAEKEASEAKARKEAELKEKYEHVEVALMEAVRMNHLPLDILDMLFNNLVPPQGEAETVAGELVRAIVRILYRDHNDGDKFFEGYGIETCGSSAEYLFDNGFAEQVEHILDMSYLLSSDDEKYTAAIENLAGDIVDHIKTNTHLLYELNETDSRDYTTEYIEENQPRYEFEVYGSDDVVTLVDNGVIDAWKLNEYVEHVLEFERFYDGAEVSRPWSHDSTTVTVENLTKDGYDHLEYSFNRDPDAFWSDLVAEYADELDNDTYDDDYNIDEE